MGIIKTNYIVQQQRTKKRLQPNKTEVLSNAYTRFICHQKSNQANRVADSLCSSFAAFPNGKIYPAAWCVPNRPHKDGVRILMIHKPSVD